MQSTRDATGRDSLSEAKADAVRFAASELRYRRLFEAAHDGILIVDPQTRKIVDVNPFLIGFLGYSHAEFLGKELYEIGLLKDEAASQVAFHELRVSGYIRYEDLPLVTKDGRRVDVEFVSNVYREGERQIIQCNVRGITRRKQTEDALRAADLQLALHAAELERVVKLRTAELQRSNAQLETFVYSTAHDLRAPLRAMQGFSQLLVEDYAAKLDANGQFYAQAISRGAQTMDRMLADLLAISHITQQKIELVPVELEAVVKAARAGCFAEIRDGRAIVEMTGLWPIVLAHAGTLQQALVNLIGNAVKFVAGRTPEVRLSAEARPGGLVRIWVADNGIGIPIAMQGKIFDVFQRLHTTEYAGTGIGLAIVQKGVERMNGKVGLESTPGEGSRFWIDLLAAAPTSVTPADTTP
jgi:PAS domain S-box-containing protein